MSDQAQPDKNPAGRADPSPELRDVPTGGEGHVDALRDGVLQGWAWFPHDPHNPARVEVRAGDELIASAVADRLREDLRKAGKHDGACAFELALPEDLPAGLALTVLACDDHGCFLLHGGERLSVPPGNPARGAPRAGEVTDAPSVLPVALNGLPGMDGFLDEFGREGNVRGWLIDERAPGGMLTLQFIEDGEVVLEVPVCDWREDLAELRQGDGGCGFHAKVPASLSDGCLHTLDVRIAGRPGSLIARPLRVRIDAPRDTAQAQQALSQAPEWRWPSPPPASLKLTVVVVFYNMRREAERTLTSLGTAYQQGVDGLEYEVLCVDNGSDPPLDEDWVRSFGPSFRLLRPSKRLPSPCAAINEAVSQARGEYVAVMIDGAHVLTPGVFREAMDAFADEPDAVVAVRQWFVGFDQRWLSVSGYTREMEDLLFQRIHWPRDGYRLFRVGAPMFESPESWFDILYESNCLFLPREVFVDMGGIDEAFSEPGGGFANLDLARRAVDAAPGPLICLIGEATFHQYHHGTTTNVADAAKDAQVRAYAMKYRRLRGREFVRRRA